MVELQKTKATQKETMTCAVCGGRTEDRLIKYMQDYKGREVIIENVPAEVCTQCGERFIRGDVAEKIQQIVWNRPATPRSKKVPVYEFADVA